MSGPRTLARYGIQFGQRETSFTVLCARDDCSWKHRGFTAEAAHIKAEQHVATTGHTVTVYEEAKTRITAGVAT